MMATATTTTEKKSRRLTGTVPSTPTKPADDAPPAVWPTWALKMRQDYEGKLADKDRTIAKLEKELMDIRQHNRERKEAERALVTYGDPSDLTTIKQRVALHPTFADLSEQGRALVAQIAHAMGINPFMHLHAWLDKKGNLHATLDYKGLLFLAGEDNIMIDSERSRLLTREEMIARGISDVDIDNGAVAAVCYVIEIDKAARCKAAGIDYHPVTGYAVQYPRQIKQGRDGAYTITNDPPNGRDHAWVAEKNALRAALYKISDLSLKLGRAIEGVQQTDDGWTAELDSDQPVIINGDTGEVIDQQPPADADAVSDTEFQEALSDLLKEPSEASNQGLPICKVDGCNEPADVLNLYDAELCSAHANAAANADAAKS